MVIAGALAELRARTLPAGFVPANIIWSPAALFPQPQSLVQQVALEETTLFTIEIQNENGCPDTAQWLVRVNRDRHIYAPNAFSPGSAHNGAFTLYGNESVQEIRLLRIFNRWGELVFERHHIPHSDPSAGWDGSFKGRLLTPQVFVWVAEIVFQNGQSQQIEGDTTIVR